VELSVNNEELELLLNDVLEVHGYDFTDYSRASMHRRINRLLRLDNFPSFAELRYRVRTDEAYLKRFVEEITVNVTEMFRDPDFYRAIREQVFPQLFSKPFIRVWHAGCSTGEEVYSMAIMLQEAGLLHKSLIYATDLNPDVLEKAGKGIFQLSFMKQYSENYIAAGGQKDFSSYYTARYDRVIFNEELRRRMVFATHNLVSDSSFNEFQLILCRNVMIYFDKDLQNKVLTLFDASLEKLGYLGLGSKETMKFSDIIAKYKQVDRHKIWKKLK
jgi:chemotaxis protein methyltransferase CheR